MGRYLEFTPRQQQMGNSVEDCARTAARGLLTYCREREWAGYDPYDALNSRIFAALPLASFRLPRLVMSQALKRSPVNIRPIALVPKTQNPKGLALFLSGLIKLPPGTVLDVDQLVASLVDRLIDLRSTETTHWCWGYSFPWQTRSTLVPRGAPNLVCTTFVAGALLDVYERYGDVRCLRMATSAAEFVLSELYWANAKSAGFSYPTCSPEPPIHNANFLGAALLCRVHRLSGEMKFVDPALRVARYSSGRQRADGSWAYGEQPTQQWIDNFHTGYNLSALNAIDRNLSTAEFQSCIRRGLRFYLDQFFRADGAVRYYHDSTYPIDIHSVAVAVITLLELREFDPRCAPLARKVLDWSLKRMWDSRGFFYYRVLRYGTIRTSYMRWSQAWMFLALATALSEQALLLAQTPQIEVFA